MATVAASAQALGVTSISLPGVGGAGKLSSSPATKPSHARKVAESEMELGAKIHLVATYNLKRGINWTSVSKPMGVSEVKKNLNSSNGECVFLPFMMSECNTHVWVLASLPRPNFPLAPTRNASFHDLFICLISLPSIR